VAPRRHRFGLYFDLHMRNITGDEVITFLRYLLRHLRGSVVLLWDGGKIHRHHDVQVFLQRYPRVEVHRFPGYAPELNPDEFVWTQAKRDLANTDHDGLLPLTLHVVRSLQRIDDCVFATTAGADRKPCFAHASTQPICRGRVAG